MYSLPEIAIILLGIWSFIFLIRVITFQVLFLIDDIFKWWNKKV